MSELTKILDRVDRIIENSSNDTLIQITNISNILEVDKKTATMLHFVNKDSSWNPKTLNVLENISIKLPIKEQELNLSLEKIKEKKDFYLINYLDNNWKTVILNQIRRTSPELNYEGIWKKLQVRQLEDTIRNMVMEVEKIGLYPTIEYKSNPRRNHAEYEDFRQIFNNSETFIYNPVADWLESLIAPTKD